MNTPPVAPPPSIFKILREEEWNTLEREGEFAGSPDDLRDGFIHFSCEEQIEGTLRKYFRDEPRVVIARVPTAGLDVRMEESRGGAFFPHLYAPLKRSEVEAFEVRELSPR